MSRPPPLLGLTGGIGSGKSTAARFFSEAGARVVDADRLARAVVRPGSPALAEIRATFGPAVIARGGELDRPRLAALVFADPAQRKRLDAIVHPRVAAAAQQAIRDIRAEDASALVVYDVPLLFETGAAAQVDLVAVVYVPRAEQVRRVVLRDGLSPAAAEQRLAAQLDIEEKARRADIVLDNQGSRAALATQVRKLMSELRSPRGEVFS